MSLIYHLVWHKEWAAQNDGKFYRPPALKTDGYIHCTRERAKLKPVADLFFDPRPGDELLLLTLDEDRVSTTIKNELAPDGGEFPHLYGPLSLDAVVGEEVLHCDETGWVIPDESGF